MISTRNRNKNCICDSNLYKENTKQPHTMDPKLFSGYEIIVNKLPCVKQLPNHNLFTGLYAQRYSLYFHSFLLTSAAAEQVKHPQHKQTTLTIISARLKLHKPYKYSRCRSSSYTTVKTEEQLSIKTSAIRIKHIHGTTNLLHNTTKHSISDTIL